MWPRLVNTSYEKTHAVWTLPSHLRVPLRALGDLVHDAFQRDGAAVGHLRGEGLLLHEVGEDAGVGGEAGEGEPEVGVELDDFFLVGGEFFGVALEGEEGVSLSSLETCWERSTFTAMRTACVRLTIPTTTEPCLTASWAYSTWKMRPWGEL